MIEYSEKLALMQELNKLKTPEEILNYIIKHYDLSAITLSSTMKPMFIDGAIRSLNLLNAKAKKKGK
jgi:hypothetical protein